MHGQPCAIRIIHDHEHTLGPVRYSLLVSYPEYIQCALHLLHHPPFAFWTACVVPVFNMIDSSISGKDTKGLMNYKLESLHVV